MQVYTISHSHLRALRVILFCFFLYKPHLRLCSYRPTSLLYWGAELPPLSLRIELPRPVPLLHPRSSCAVHTALHCSNCTAMLERAARPASFAA